MPKLTIFLAILHFDLAEITIALAKLKFVLRAFGWFWHIEV